MICWMSGNVAPGRNRHGRGTILHQDREVAPRRSDYHLVSEDEDLLILGQYEGVQIVNAATFLSILDQRDMDSDE